MNFVLWLLRMNYRLVLPNVTSFSIDAHGLKIQGRGVSEVFAKIPGGGGGQGFQKKLPGGGSPYFGFYCIFINNCFEICQRGTIFTLPPGPPVCIYEL